MAIIQNELMTLPDLLLAVTAFLRMIRSVGGPRSLSKLALLISELV